MSGLFATATRTDPNLIDEKILSEFIAFMGDDGDDLAKDLVALYLKKTPALIAKIEGDILSNDMDGLKNHVHSLKGSSAQLGVVGVSEVCKSIENVLLVKQYDEIGPLLDQLVSNYRQIEQTFSERL